MATKDQPRTPHDDRLRAPSRRTSCSPNPRTIDARLPLGARRAASSSRRRLPVPSGIGTAGDGEAAAPRAPGDP